jgi:hypothetical protein
MNEVPKIVYDRLRAARPERALPVRGGPELAHPDANLLTAFAEQALSVTEREGVLAHLAFCRDCRDAITLALPAADIVAATIAAESEAVRPVVPAKAERNWLTARKLAWPGLRWATLAAGIAVVASVLLLRPGKLNQPMPPSENPQLATTAPPASSPQIASSAVVSSPTDQSAVLAKTKEPQLKSELRLSKKLKAGQIEAPSHQSEQGILLAENKKDAGQADRLSPASPAGAASLNAPASGRATEAVEVSGAAVAIEATPSAESSLMARNETPAIEKAKPALPGMEAQETQATGVPPAKSQARSVTFAAKLASPASQVLVHNASWTITAGALQRSMDNGQSWQNSLHVDHPLLCYAAHDNDVWTGGQAGTLFHSADNGVTWVQVQPSAKGQQLSSDVTHVDLRGAAEIVVSTKNNGIWSSEDGGKIWEKK